MGRGECPRLGQAMFPHFPHVTVLHHRQRAGHRRLRAGTVPGGLVHPGLQMVAASVFWGARRPRVGMPIDPSILARSAFHGEVSACGKVVPQDEPPHLLVLSLDCAADLPRGRRPPPRLDMPAQPLLMPHGQVGLVGEDTPSRHHVHVPEALAVRHVHAIRHRRVAVAPPTPVGRIRRLVDAVEDRHTGLRGVPWPGRPHVDDPVGRPRPVHGRGRRFHHLHLIHVFHGQVGPPNLPQISAEQGQAVQQHLDTASHAVAVPAASTDADLAVQNGHAGCFGHESLEIEGVCALGQIGFQHGHGDGFLRHGGPPNAGGDHRLGQGLGVGFHHHIHAAGHGQRIAVQGLGHVPHKTHRHGTRPGAICRLGWAQEPALQICQRVHGFAAARPTHGGTWQRQRLALFGNHHRPDGLGAGLPHDSPREQRHHHRGQHARQTHGPQGVSFPTRTNQIHLELLHDLAGSLSHPRDANFPPFPGVGLALVWLPSPFPQCDSHRPALLRSKPGCFGNPSCPIRRIQRLGWTNLGRRSHMGHGPVDGARQHTPFVPGFGSVSPPLACRGDSLSCVDRPEPDKRHGARMDLPQRRQRDVFGRHGLAGRPPGLGVRRRHRRLLHAVVHPRRGRTLGTCVVRFDSQPVGR